LADGDYFTGIAGEIKTGTEDLRLVFFCCTYK
jgi:hypothetical protein